ncbi:predicted protein [Nematostella vectensis]|uniref:BTB domain-containing protein n=1 Tax=Nematostella vectensis TaxID=45351 RepID=A7RKJ4_NEMVE|nr:predicted protein [Nematostella vectensis]|eukprot:XP_001640060.1 predicted protein [Nematostella vectensis]
MSINQRPKNSRKLCEIDQTQAVIQQLDKLRRSGLLCDVTIVVNGREFPAHRAVLAASGGFFAGLFASNMQENSQNIVNLGEIDPEVTEDVLTFIYTGQIELTTENAVAILKAADFLLLETLKSPVDSFLASMCQHISANPLRSYGIALDYKSPLFKTTALDLVCADFLDVIKSNEFLEISTETIQEIFSSDDLLVNSEEEVFHALLKWVKHNPGDREPLFPTLFPLIRSLSEEFLKSVVFSEQLVFAQPKCLGHVLDCITNEPRPRDCLDREDAVSSN